MIKTACAKFCKQNYPKIKRATHTYLTLSLTFAVHLTPLAYSRPHHPPPSPFCVEFVVYWYWSYLRSPCYKGTPMRPCVCNWRARRTTETTSSVVSPSACSLTRGGGGIRSGLGEASLIACNLTTEEMVVYLHMEWGVCYCVCLRKSVSEKEKGSEHFFSHRSSSVSVKN